MFKVGLVTIFYSPKLNTCIYVDTLLVKRRDGDFIDEYHLTAYDYFTKQEIKSFKSNLITETSDKETEYKMFLKEYQ